MTEQYQQTNINVPRPARFVDQSDLVGGVVPLSSDDRVIVCGDDGVTGVYNLRLPNAQLVDGLILIIKSPPTNPVDVRIDPPLGQTLEGGTISLTAGMGFSAIVVADPVDNSGPVPVLPTNWSRIKVGAP